MKIARPVVALAVLGCLAGGVDAHAAPKKVCSLLVDPAGDAKGLGVLPSDDTLDIVSADFGSDKKRLTIVMRMKKAAQKSSTYPTGLKWQTNFSVDGTGYFASVVSDGGVSGAFGTTGTGSNTIVTRPDGVIDPVKNEVRITVPFGDFPTGIGKTATLSAISVSTSTTKTFSTPVISGSTGGLAPDNATTDKTYKLQTPSCVTVGK